MKFLFFLLSLALCLPVASDFFVTSFTVGAREYLPLFRYVLSGSKIFLNDAVELNVGFNDVKVPAITVAGEEIVLGMQVLIAENIEHPGNYLIEQLLYKVDSVYATKEEAKNSMQGYALMEDGTIIPLEEKQPCHAQAAAIEAKNSQSAETVAVAQKSVEAPAEETTETPKPKKSCGGRFAKVLLRIGIFTALVGFFYHVLSFIFSFFAPSPVNEYVVIEEKVHFGKQMEKENQSVQASEGNDETSPMLPEYKA